MTWAVDTTGAEPALLIAVPFDREQPLVCVPGTAVNRASDDCRREGKADARDAYVIVGRPGSTRTCSRCDGVTRRQSSGVADRPPR